MSDAIDTQFLAEGIARYEQALDTIATFEMMLSERLRVILKGYSCQPFVPTKDEIETKPGRGDTGKWIWAGQRGRLRSRGLVWLELGIWWSNGQIAYYCNFCEDSSKSIDFTYNGTNDRIKFKLWSKSARLFMLTSKERYEAMNDDVTMLLNELMLSFS